MECGCKVVAQARIDTLVLMRTTQSRKMQQTGTWAHEVAPSNGRTVERGSAGVEHAGTRRMQRMQRGYAGLFMKMTRTTERVTCKVKWRNSCITMNRNCLACGKGGIGMATKAGGLIRNCAPRQDVKEVECIRRHKMYTRVPR